MHSCSHPIEFATALYSPGLRLERLRNLRPNAAMVDQQELCQIGHLEAGDPAALCAYISGRTRRLPNSDVLGGCCGTWDDHLHAIVEDLRSLHSAA